MASDSNIFSLALFQSKSPVDFCSFKPRIAVGHEATSTQNFDELQYFPSIRRSGARGSCVTTRRAAWTRGRSRELTSAERARAPHSVAGAGGRSSGTCDLNPWELV